MISLQNMGSLSEILFVAAAIIGLVSSRIFLFGAGEGGVNASALRRSLGLVSMVLTYSLFAWGFVSLSWYWPLAAYCCRHRRCHRCYILAVAPLVFVPAGSGLRGDRRGLLSVD